MDTSINTTDHDLLVELRTEMKGMREDMKGLRDDTKVTITDHETRLRKLERWTYLAIGGAYALELALKYFIR